MEEKQVLLRRNLIDFNLFPTARRVINSWSKSIPVQGWDFQSSWKTRSLAILKLEHFLIERLLNLQSPTLQSILVGLFPLLWNKTDKACYCPFDIVYPLTVQRKSLYRICSKISYSMSHTARVHASWVLWGIRGIKWLAYEKEALSTKPQV